MHNSRSARSEHRHHHHPHKQRDDDDESGHTVFFAAEAESHEWLCRRLGIKVLPVVVGYIAGKEVGRVVGFDELKGGEGAGWTGLGWILGRWVAGGREWSGTMGLDDAGVGGLLGVGWEDWVCGGGVAKDDGRRGGGDDGDDVDQRERRRDAGYVGGGDGNGRFRIGGRSGRQKRDVNDGDDDEDWD